MTSLLPAASRGGEVEREVLISSDRTCGNGSKLCQGRFRLSTSQHFVTERVGKHWNRLPREVLKAPSLAVLGQHP